MNKNQLIKKISLYKNFVNKTLKYTKYFSDEDRVNSLYRFYTKSNASKEAILIAKKSNTKLYNYLNLSIEERLKVFNQSLELKKLNVNFNYYHVNQIKNMNFFLRVLKNKNPKILSLKESLSNDNEIFLLKIIETADSYNYYFKENIKNHIFIECDSFDLNKQEKNIDTYNDYIFYDSNYNNICYYQHVVIDDLMVIFIRYIVKNNSFNFFNKNLLQNKDFIDYHLKNNLFKYKNVPDMIKNHMVLS